MPTMVFSSLSELIQSPITSEMIAYVASMAHQVIECSPKRQPGTLIVPPLETFISQVVSRSHVSTATFLTTLVILDRFKRKLPRAARGMHCTRHRIFLATLIVTAKTLNDSSPKNKHWARYSGGVFSAPEVNLMEKQLLASLDFELRVQESDLYAHLSVFLVPISIPSYYSRLSAGRSGVPGLLSSLEDSPSGDEADAVQHFIDAYYPSPPHEIECRYDELLREYDSSLKPICMASSFDTVSSTMLEEKGTVLQRYMYRERAGFV
ncbi:uncharacterized protein VTP21DRAFT_1771 [Calcarisporiella thermophila]|uniref:uncharacterized protein n=1 Tax=Calcarisporiella thermophila TaxID=911321 RepID=UPI00374380FA